MSSKNKVAVYVCQKKSSNDFDKIESYCKYNNIEDYDVYIDKVSSRRDKSDRKALEQLKKDVKCKKINTVIVSEFEGISRDIKFNYDFVDFIQKNNCKIIFSDGSDLVLNKEFREYMTKFFNGACKKAKND